MLTKIYSPMSRIARQMSKKQALVRPKVIMDEETENMILNEEVKARKHSGRMNTRLAELPNWLPGALETALEDSSMATILKESLKLANYLKERQTPNEVPEIQRKYAEIRATVESRRKLDSIAKLSVESLQKIEHALSLRKLKRAFYGWAPVEYNKHASQLYLVGRSAQEYAVLHRILHEICTRDKDFQPKTLLDFGSGVGTVTWATSQLWPTMIKEHVNVDVSTDMHDLSELIINHANPKIKGHFYRQFIPLSRQSYDIVVCAYTLLELPDMRNRLEIITKLWEKTARYLVIVEQGTKAGFKLVNEARDIILHLHKSKNETGPEASAHVFAPCPHDLKCPRYKLENASCYFDVFYHPLPLRNRANPQAERYSYVILKRGERGEKSKNWPRIVQKVIRRSKHTICRMCTANGTLDEVIFTRKTHGQPMYWCARSSRWGDRLPLEVQEPDDTENETEDKDENESENEKENKNEAKNENETKNEDENESEKAAEEPVK